MLVIVAGKLYNSDEVPIIIKLSKEDKENILDVINHNVVNTYMAYGKDYKNADIDFGLLVDGKKEEMIDPMNSIRDLFPDNYSFD